MKVLRVCFIFFSSILLFACGNPKTETSSAMGLTRELKALSLPDGCATPDGMALGQDRKIYLSINQSGSNFENAGKIISLNENDNFEKVITLPPHKKTGVCSPMGITFASDGNLYVVDNQAFANAAGCGRILCVKFQNGSAVSCDVVVDGIQTPNGIAQKGKRIYITDCSQNVDNGVVKSSVYSFDIDKLKSGCVNLKGNEVKYLVKEFYTKFERGISVGADGIAFDENGILHIAIAGNASVVKLELDDNGRVLKESLLFKGLGLACCDGLQFDSDGNLWIADFYANAIAKFDVKNQKMEFVWRNIVPSDDCGLRLNAPAEALRRGNKLYISNMNVNMFLHKRHSKDAISVLNLR